MLHRLWDAFRTDRSLQIALLAFVILYIGFQQRLAAKEQMYLAAGQMTLETSHHGSNVHEDGPFIVELPAGPETAIQIMVAQLSGRPIHVKDADGNWHIMRPLIGPSGRVEDHSDAVISLAKVSCADDAPREIKAAFNELSQSARLALCELAETS